MDIFETIDLNMAPKNNEKTPRTRTVVLEAIRALNHPNGSSLYAIKKYCNENFKMNRRSDYFIKKFIRAAVLSGLLTRTNQKRMGAAGSFKITKDIINEDGKDGNLNFENLKLENFSFSWRRREWSEDDYLKISNIGGLLPYIN